LELPIHVLVPLHMHRINGKFISGGNYLHTLMGGRFSYSASNFQKHSKTWESTSVTASKLTGVDFAFEVGSILLRGV